jgi:uncharacterized protein YjiS (DUF1127 family)
MTRTRRAGTIIPSGVSFGPIILDLTGLFALWRERSRQRRELMKLDRRLLRDIGVGRIEADNEARKPFWRS